jgi:dihydropteroate synthase
MIKYLNIGPATFAWGSQTYVMGIINITSDSFSGDGLLSEQEWVARAVEQGMRFAREGAHILDIGGESTRPGAEAVEADEEIRRVVPVIAALATKVNLPLSVDTYKADVAAAALDAGSAHGQRCVGLKNGLQDGRPMRATKHTRYCHA